MATMSGLWLASYIALWCLIGLEGLLLVAVLKQVIALQRQLAPASDQWGLPIGALAPTIVGPDLNGRAVAWGAEAGQMRMVLFLAPGCPGCVTAMRQMHRTLGVLNCELFIVIAANRAGARHFVAEHARGGAGILVPLVADPTGDVRRAYGVVATPMAFVVNPSGIIAARAVAVSAEDMRNLLHEAISRAGATSVVEAVVAGGIGDSPADASAVTAAR